MILVRPSPFKYVTCASVRHRLNARPDCRRPKRVWPRRLPVAHTQQSRVVGDSCHFCHAHAGVFCLESRAHSHAHMHRCLTRCSYSTIIYATASASCITASPPTLTCSPLALLALNNASLTK